MSNNFLFHIITIDKIIEAKVSEFNSGNIIG